MLRITVVALFVVALAGCASDEDGIESHFPGVERTQVEVFGENLTIFLEPIIEVSATAEGPWSNNTELVLDAGIVQMPEPSGPAVLPTQTGTTLALPALPQTTLHLRLKEANSLRELDAVWMRVVGEQAEILATQPADAHFMYNVTQPGRFEFIVFLGKGEDLQAASGVPAVVRVDGHWTVHGMAWPVNPQGAAPLDDAQRASMADRLTLEAALGGTLTTNTRFDGTYTQTDGTDVDLEHGGPDGFIACVGAGGAGGMTPDPAQATETLSSPITKTGQYTVRVGYVSSACGANYFHNPGNVPYVADIQLDY